MQNKLLLIIDVQNYFLTPRNKKIKQKIIKELKKYDHVIATKFINTKKSPFNKLMNWPYCTTKKECAIPKKIYKKANMIIKKDTYSAYGKKLKKYIKNNNIKKIYICGLDIDGCVLKTALDLFDNNYNIYILKKYCETSGTKQDYKHGLKVLKRTLGKNRIIKNHKQ